MTKSDFSVVITDLRTGRIYENSSTNENPLDGLALADFPKKKVVRREAIISFLR